jgi:hypothetical protein
MSGNLLGPSLLNARIHATDARMGFLPRLMQKEGKLAPKEGNYSYKSVKKPPKLAGQCD